MKEKKRKRNSTGEEINETNKDHSTEKNERCRNLKSGIVLFIAPG
jgi:hypothetical protein